MKNLQEIINNLIPQYNEKQMDYVEFTNYIKRKIENLLFENSIRYQSITCRVKDVNSLKNKLNKFAKKIHGDIRNLKDLSGIRIIIYDREEAEKIVQVLEEHFKIDDDVPPRENYDARNVTISLTDKNIVKFANMRCEVQIVGILSHALIELGHDIFYKDKEELKKKGPKKYAKLKEIYDETFKDIIKSETKMKLIKIEAANIKKGYTALNRLIDENYIKVIRASNDCDKINYRIQEFNTAAEFLSNSQDSIKILMERHLIWELVSAFVNIPYVVYSKKNNFYYRTFEYTYDQLIDVLGKYIYLWLDDLEKIISTLNNHILKHEHSQNNSLTNKLSKMIVTKLKHDKESKQFMLINPIFVWITSNPETQMNLKLDTAVEYCNLDLQYLENSGYRKFKIWSGQINPNEKYKENIRKIIFTYCELYLKSKDLNLFRKIISMCHQAQNCQKNFKRDYLLDFFNDHYDEIDAHIKWKIYTFGINQGKELFYNTEIYKKIKNDEICILYSYLYSYILDEIPSSSFEVTDAVRKDYLKKYVESLRKENEEEIIEICNLMNTYEGELCNSYSSYDVSEFLYEIRKEYTEAYQLYKKTQNVYILFGLYCREDFKIQIDKEKTERILKYGLLSSSIFPEKLFEQIFDIYNIGDSHQLDNYMCRIVLSDEKLLNTSRYLAKVMEIIIFYNNKKQSVLEHCTYLRDQSQFIRILGKRRLKTIFDNLSYKQIQSYDDLFIHEVFEFYPDIVRRFIKKYLENGNPVTFNNFNFYLYKCKNISNELKNNILLAIELLEKNAYYNIINVVRNLVHNYNQNVFNELKVLIEQNKNLKEVTYLLKILSVSTSGWNAMELLIQNTDNQDIIHEIENILFDSITSGEYGLANSYKSKYEFFDNLYKQKDNKNKRVIQFIIEQRKRFETLYLSEKNKVTKRTIEEQEIYNMNK